MDFPFKIKKIPNFYYNKITAKNVERINLLILYISYILFVLHYPILKLKNNLYLIIIKTLIIIMKNWLI